MGKIRLCALGMLILIITTQSVLADGDDNDDDDGDENEPTILGLEGESLGSAALFLLIATLMIIVWKPTFMWLRKHGPEQFNQEPREFKRKLGIVHRYFMKIHIWIGVGAALLGTIHGWILEWHWTLWAGMIAIWVLVFSGSLMQWRNSTKSIRKGARLLHMQRTLSVIAVVLLLIGHGMVD